VSSVLNICILLVINLFYACQLHGRCTVLTFVPIKLGEKEEEEVTVSLYIFVNYSLFAPCSAACFELQYRDQVCVKLTDCIACTLLRLITIKLKIISLT
jgi:hypothetical protein